MFAAVLLRRCKDKKNLANDVHCEPYFLQKYCIFLKICTFSHYFYPQAVFFIVKYGFALCHQLK